MNTKENETNQPKEKEDNFLRIFDNVKRCKALDWIERAILSNHISYLINGKEFYQTDSYQAKELGLSAAQVSKYTGRLRERGLIHTEIDYEENQKGGRPIPVRYVTVIDMDKWTKGDSVPVVKKFISPKEKKEALKKVALKQANPTGEQALQPKEKVDVEVNTKETKAIVNTTPQPEKVSTDSDKSSEWIKIVDSQDLLPISKHELRKAIHDNIIVSEEHLKECIQKMKEIDLQERQ